MFSTVLARVEDIDIIQSAAIVFLAGVVATATIRGEKRFRLLHRDIGDVIKSQYDILRQVNDQTRQMNDQAQQIVDCQMQIDGLKRANVRQPGSDA